jgi:hypothetical protein
MSRSGKERAAFPNFVPFKTPHPTLSPFQLPGSPWSFLYPPSCASVIGKQIVKRR